MNLLINKLFKMSSMCESLLGKNDLFNSLPTG